MYKLPHHVRTKIISQQIEEKKKEREIDKKEWELRACILAAYFLLALLYPPQSDKYAQSAEWVPDEKMPDQQSIDEEEMFIKLIKS
ncbi:MAG TPA: hypothetical protein VI731_09325 [Bacteroidia bacterium]|nr:hypothetical protein [Bacteroidia bacterium]